MRRHVAIISADLADPLLSGRKRIESRLSRRRRVPFGRVRRGDLIYFKLVAGEIIGRSRVARVLHLVDLTPRRLDDLRRRYGPAIAAPADYWQQRRDCRFGVLIWLAGLEPAWHPPRVARQYGNGWIVL